MDVTDFVTLATSLSRHVTDNVTDVLEKNPGKTVFACRAVVLLTKAGHAVTDKKGGDPSPRNLNRNPYLNPAPPFVLADYEPPAISLSYTFLHFLHVAHFPGPPLFASSWPASIFSRSTFVTL